MKPILFLFLFFSPISLIAQDLSNEASDSLVHVLDSHKTQMKRGDINSLHYLGQLLDDTTRMGIKSYSRHCLGCRYWSTIQTEAYERVEEFILFKNIQLTKTTSSQQFLSFLDTQQKNIRFFLFP